MSRITALVDRLQALRVYVLLEQPPQLHQAVGYTRHQVEHAADVLILVLVEEFLESWKLN